MNGAIGRYLLSLSFFFLLNLFESDAQSIRFAYRAPQGGNPSVIAAAGAAVDSRGFLYITEPATHSVLVFNKQGARVDTIQSVPTSSGEVMLKSPLHICVDLNDQIYIYDEGYTRVFVKSHEGIGKVFGEKGTARGQIEDVGGIAVDSRGYLYVLNRSRREINVYCPDGSFLTWILGAANSFSEPHSIGINGADELYVLDKEGPSVFMYSPSGNLINTNRNIARKPGISLTKPIGMAVMRSGDFFVLDAASGSATQFSKVGEVRGSMGARGPSREGVFEEPAIIAAGSAYTKALVVLDVAAGLAQVFEVNTGPAPLNPGPKRMQLIPGAGKLPSMKDIAVTSNGRQYIIPSSNSRVVAVYQDSTGKELFSITDQLEDAAALAVDASGNLLVVDRKAGEVVMFDPKGVLVRKFGHDKVIKLKDPSSLTIQSNGNIVVADRSAQCLHMWNSDGVYQKIITSSVNTALQSPVRIQRDTKDQIYIWDDKENCIFRVGTTGWPMARERLRVRPDKPGGKEGSIGGFFIDPLDQIHVFNATTSQLEVYSWEIEPVLLFSTGRPGPGSNSMDEVERILLDDRNMIVYFPLRKTEEVKVYEFLVKPPVPETDIHFDVSDGKLLVYFTKSNVRSVESYGLITESKSGQDSLAAESTSAMIFLNPSASGDIELRHYNLVHISRSDFSDPGPGFDDYFGYANQLLLAGRYDDALESYEIARRKMGGSTRMNQFISDNLSQTALALAARGEVDRAYQCVRESYKLTPADGNILKSYGSVILSYFRHLAGRNDLDDVLSETERHMGDVILRKVVWASVDSLAKELCQSPREEVLLDGIRLQKKLVNWDAGNPHFSASLAEGNYRLYRLRYLNGARGMETTAILGEASKYAQQAVTGLRKSKEYYADAHLLYLDILLAMGKFGDAEKDAAKELAAASAALSEKNVVRYRIRLAQAYSGEIKNDLAVKEYQLVHTLDPDNREVSLALARAFVVNGQYDDAKRMYQELLLLDRTNAELIAEIGRVELIQGNYTEASFQLEKAIQQDPAERSFYGPLGEAFDGNRNYKKALENYDIAIQYQQLKLDFSKKRMASSEDIRENLELLARYLVRKGKLNEQLGDPGEAVSAYQRLVDLDPSSAEAYYSLGTACLSAGLVYDAVNALHTAVQLSPDNEVYHNASANAVKLRDQVSHNEQALTILDLHVDEVFPSLYRNYADAALLPIGEIVIANNTSTPVTPLSITVNVQGLTSGPTELKSTPIVGYSNKRVRLNVLFSRDIMDITSDENRQLDVEIKYSESGKVRSATKSVTFLLHGRNAISWSDKRRLSAFVSPSEEKLIDYTKKADALFDKEPGYGMNTNILKAMQLYTLLNKSQYVYSPDPVQTFAAVSTRTDQLDFLQYPAETMKRRSGDCDDLVALFASLLENSGIAAAYVDVPGHVFMAFDLGIKSDAITEAGLTSTDVIIRSDKVWVPIETTLIGTQDFMDAWKSASERYYSELTQGHFPEVVPLSEARSVYLPSSYLPEGFNEEPPTGRSVTQEYSRVLSELLAKTKKEVISELESRYQMESGNVYVKTRFATMLAQTGESDRAEKVLMEALEIAPGNAAVLNNLGNIYYLRGDSSKAITYYSKAADADKNDAEILVNLCKASLMGGQQSEAKQYFEQATKLNPEIASLYLELKSVLK